MRSTPKIIQVPSRVPILSRAGFILVSHLVLVSHLGFAAEPLVPAERARKYLDANLVLIGDVVSYTTQTVQEEDSLRDDGWMYHHVTLMDVYNVRVDSVLKGSLADSIIRVQSKLFGGSTSRSKFLEVDEKGDSLYVAEIWAGDGGDGADRIRKLGRHIIILLMVLQREDTTYTSVLGSPYSESVLHFYKEVEEKGEEYIKTLEPTD